LISKNKIKFINSLKEKKYRQLHSLFVVEGDKIVSEIIHQEPARIEQLFLTANWIKRSGLSSGQKSALPVIILKPGEMERISSLKSPPGAIALMQIPRYQLEVDEIAGKLSLVLDKIRDPGNLGNIIRIADWFGIDNIICSADCADCFNPKVLQSSMGSIMRVRIHYTGLEILLQKLTQLPEFGVYGTFPQAPDIYTADLLPRGIIIMGNESKGITGGLLPFIRERISIPAFQSRSGKMDSLNVAAATAIICSEFRRRLR
jgi:TrmH family RNA methyltransferase